MFDVRLDFGLIPIQSKHFLSPSTSSYLTQIRDVS